MTEFLRGHAYTLVLLTGLLFLIFGTSKIVQAQYCNATPPPGCSWEVIDTYCAYVVWCTNGTSYCFDNFPGQVGCCYTEIGTIIEGGTCRASGCTTFKRCYMGTCGRL